jgi:2-dehydro-3-deoxyphosphogalactonate aldolase
MMDLDQAFRCLPLVAILRGLRPEEAEPIGAALVEAGLTLLEVPLNSPDPMISIGRLARAFGERALVGAGTVRRFEEVEQIAAAGGRLIVTPHADVALVRRAKALGLYAMPGCFTPTEAFSLLDAGADALKLFPAEAAPPPVLRALMAVLPRGTRVLPVGGIEPGNMAAYVRAGAAGFGIGSALYRPGDAPEAMTARSVGLVAAWRAATGG